MEKKHPTYTIVTDPKEADAVGWGFYSSDVTKPEKVYFKFPTLKEDDLRIQITHAGLCHSEVHTISGDWVPVKNFPIIPGHEIAGVVTHVGTNVKDFKVGDKVGFGCYRDFCGSCKKCQKGHDNFCPKIDQVFTYGDLYWGGYATALQNPAKLFFHIPEGLPEEQVPPIFCAGVTSFNPVAKYCKKGDEVAVLGVGGVGHMALQYAHAWGCKVTAFTTSKGKDEFLKKLGADRVVVTTEPGALEKEAYKYDVVLNSTPVSDDKSFNAYFNLLDSQGVWVQLGAPNVSTSVPFHLSNLPFTERTLCGSQVGPKKVVQETLDFSAKHKVLPLVEVFEFDDFPKAWDKLINGRPIFRCVIKCKDGLKKH